MFNELCRTLVGTLLLAFMAPALAQADADGPYLLPARSDGWTAHWVEPVEEGVQARSEPTAVGSEITIPAVGSVPSFVVQPRGPAETAADEHDMPSEAPLLVLADTHGEYEILVELLRSQGVLDERLAWGFGKGHLVLLGDVFDRGAHQVEILWLIYKLDAEAAAAGGSVHLLLGNHEALVLRGDERYLNPRYLRTAETLGAASYSELFAPETLLGQWLRSRPAVLKLDDLLLLHGGISPEMVERGLSPATINRTVRGVLDGTVDADEELAQLVMTSSGPLWYRGYFPSQDAPPAATQADVEASLRHFGVGTILVGHTIVPTVTPLYDGKVIAVQVYPRRDEDTGAAVMEGALRKDGAWYRAGVDGSRQLMLPGKSPPAAADVPATAAHPPRRSGE